MEESKSYFDLVTKAKINLTDRQLSLILNSNARFIPINKWKAFNENHSKKIADNVQIHYEYLGEHRIMYYSVRTEIGAGSYNVYDNIEKALNVSAVDLYLEERAGGEIN